MISFMTVGLQVSELTVMTQPLTSGQSHCTDDALTVEEVEGYFYDKLDGMSDFDSFMDYNLVSFLVNCT